MTEQPGRFEYGRWVETAPVPLAGDEGIDRKLHDALQSASTSLDALAGIARDLVTTEEGRHYLETTLAGTQAGVRHSLDAILRQTREGMAERIRG